jgi:hypothetical protein
MARGPKMHIIDAFCREKEVALLEFISSQSVQMTSSVRISLPNGIQYTQPTCLFIDNKWVPGDSDTFSVLNPAYDNPFIL